MPYVIELISLGKDLYPILETASARLNAVQSAFLFRSMPASSSQRMEGLAFSRDPYVTTEVYAFIEGQRKRLGGNHPHIIAFVDAPLESKKLTNIFGSHSGGKGIAVVTFDDMSQYVREETRYCCYFLTRYALSFVNPAIESHVDPARSSCYFNKKMRKIEIRESMDSGDVCNDCLNQLENPSATSGANIPSAEELAALARMREVVSGDIAHAIVMKGGGAKGLAFASALIELEKYFWFDRHVGTSAGAIAAILLAAGYSPKELEAILKKKAFREFMDARWWQIPFNLLMKRGAFPGEHFRLWVADLIGKRSKKVDEIRMSDLKGALVYAARRGSGTVEFDSTGERSETVAAFAVRCSMSIPLVFYPQEVDGRRVFDGGLRNNFPLRRFLATHGAQPFVALYLGKRDDTNLRWFSTELIDILIDGEERAVVDEHRDNVVVIDTSPIGTLDFNLSSLEKELLLAVGRASALEFLRDRKFDDAPDDVLVVAERERAEGLRTTVIAVRKWRRLKCFALGLAILIMILLWWWLRRHL